MCTAHESSEILAIHVQYIFILLQITTQSPLNDVTTHYDSGFASQMYSPTSSLLATSFRQPSDVDTSSATEHKQYAELQCYRPDLSSRHDSALASFDSASDSAQTAAMTAHQAKGSPALGQRMTQIQWPTDQTMMSPIATHASYAHHAFYMSAQQQHTASSWDWAQQLHSTAAYQAASPTMTSSAVAPADYTMPQYPAHKPYIPLTATGFYHSTPASCRYGPSAIDCSSYSNIVPPFTPQEHINTGNDNNRVLQACQRLSSDTPPAGGASRKRGSSARAPPRSPLKRDKSSRFVSKFSAHDLAVLNAWYDTHREHPYPAPDELKRLVEQCDMTKLQIQRWFNNTRRKNNDVKTPGEVASRRRDAGLQSWCEEMTMKKLAEYK